jgi:hypothetical protein
MWKLSKITKLIAGKDGLIRSAKVKTSSGKILGRPLCLLYPIEMSETDVDSIENDFQSKTCQTVDNKKQQRRAAAVAESRIKQVYSIKNVNEV